MEIFVMSAAGIYDWPIIKQVSWLLGQVMNGIYNALSAIGIENIGVAIIVFTINGQSGGRLTDAFPEPIGFIIGA